MNNVLETSLELTRARSEVFFELSEMPVFCNVLWSDQQAARNCPTGDIHLAFHPESGFISNTAFAPSRVEYSQAYENSLDFSPCFQNYAKSLAMRLIERYNLRHRHILEIGCGKGDFLLLLCELGDNWGVGFDPSYVTRSIPKHLHNKIEFIRDFYSNQYAHYPADLIACRHTLEHVQEPTRLLKTLRQSLTDRFKTAVFFEVPNALDIVQRLAIWDIIYEHCGYFTPTSLFYAFTSCGFQVNYLTEAFSGQFLCLEATPAETTTMIVDRPIQSVQSLAQDVARFSEQFQQKVDRWKQRLEQMAKCGKRVVLWGAGSKGATFLNILKVENEIEYVIDINPRKHQMFIPGTGQQIMPPEFLQAYQPEVVIIMNPIYKDEICCMIEALGLNPELLCA